MSNKATREEFFELIRRPKMIEKDVKIAKNKRFANNPNHRFLGGSTSTKEHWDKHQGR